MSAEAQNLERIVRAVEHHDRTCAYHAIAVAMNPFERERLGWDSIRGLPIRDDSSLGTGRFRVICSRDEPSVDEGEAVEQRGREEVLA